MTQPQKPAQEKTYGEIWADFRDNPHYRGLDISELHRIHRTWRRIGKEVSK